MPVQKIHDERLTIGVTTSVLFDMSEPNAVYEKHKEQGYRSYMKERMDEPLKPGAAFEWIQNFAQHPNHDVVLFSRNSALTALRAVKTMTEHEVIPRRFVFTNGNDPTRYLKVYQIDQFMSAHENDVLKARHLDIPSIYIRREDLNSISSERINRLYQSNDTVTPLRNDKTAGGNVVTLTNRLNKAAMPLHHIFDFDGVLGDDAAEEYFQKHGLEAFQELEKSNVNVPIAQGPIYPYFEKISRMNQRSLSGPPYLVSIVTSAGVYAGIRRLYALAHKDIEPNCEFHAISGLGKGPIVKILQNSYPGSALFVDDGKKNVDDVQKHGVLSGRVLIPPKGPENAA